MVSTENAKLQANGGLIVSQKSRVPGFAHYAAIIGKYELNATEVIGFIKEKAPDPGPITKVGRSSLKMLHHVSGVDHVT